MSLSPQTINSLTTLLVHLIDTQTTVLIFLKINKTKTFSLLQQLKSLQQLIEINEQTQYTLFKSLDAKANGQLQETDLLDCFLSQGIAISSEQARTLFTILDVNHDDYITLQDFAHYFPTTPIPPISQKQFPLPAPFQMFHRISYHLVKSQESTVKLRNELIQQIDFSISKCFQAIDVQNKGYINLYNMGVFLKSKGRPRIQKEIQSFISSVAQNEGIDYKLFADLITGRNQKEGMNQSLIGSQQIKKNISSSPSNVQQQPSYQQQQKEEKEIKPISKFIEQNYDLPQTKIVQSMIVPLQSQEQEQQQQLQQQVFQEQKTKSEYFTQPVNQETTISSNFAYPLSEPNMKELINVLKKLIDWERELQQLKIGLSQSSDFNLLDAFRYFDVNQNEEISKQELEEGLNKLGLFPTETELYLFYQSYDRDIDSFLQFGEFNQIFYTPNSEQVELMNSKAPNFAESPIKQLFTYETRMLFKTTMQQLIEIEVLFNNLRTQLSKRKNFNLKSAFNSLDVSQDGIISYEDLREILNRFKIVINEEDMINLFRRFDRNLDGVINYEEFIQEMAVKI